MKCLIAGTVIPEDFDWEIFSTVYITDHTDLSNLPQVAEESSVVLYSRNADSIAEDILDSVSELVESTDPVTDVLEKLTPSDVAIMNWDDSALLYETLEKLHHAGLVTLDSSDEYKELVIDHQIDLDYLINLITEKVTKNVIAALREEDAPRRRRRAAGRVRNTDG
jgi:sensor histidine kinase regulating citrate/malate metabolism